MMSKAREMTQHGGPPGWLEESDPTRCCDGRSMPHSLTDSTDCPGLELLSFKRLANLAAAVDILVLNVSQNTVMSLIKQERQGPKLPAVFVVGNL
jgi:hypothetical protein